MSTKTEKIQESTKEGNIDCAKIVPTKKKNEWHANFCKLVGGSFFVYKNNKPETKPYHVFHLNELRIEENFKESDRQPCFGFNVARGDERFLYVFSGSEDLSGWVQALKKSLNKDPVQLTMQESKFDKAKKNIVGSSAGTSYGKTVLNKVLDKPGREAVKAIKKIITVQTGSKAVAETVEKKLFKLIVKTYFLFEKQVFTLPMLFSSEECCRKIMKLIFTVHTNYDKLDAASRDQIVPKKSQEINSGCIRLALELKNLLSAHISAKNLQKIDDILEVFNTNFFETLFTKNNSLPETIYVADLFKGVLGWEASQCENPAVLYSDEAITFGRK